MHCRVVYRCAPGIALPERRRRWRPEPVASHQPAQQNSVPPPSSLAIPTIRTVAADLATRAHFDLDSIDDLRMAVEDACAMLVRIAAPNATLSCRFTVRADRIELAADADVDVDDGAEALPTGSFGWRVLSLL